MPWTSERVTALAPDANAAKTARGLATLAKWSDLGSSDRAVWGSCQGSGKQPYRVQIDLSEPAYRCSCPSRKFPCKHALGLLFLFAEQPDALPSAPLPDPLREWLDRRDTRTPPEPEPSPDPRNVADPDARARRVSRREAKVQAGIDELSQWLSDFIRQGLAAAPHHPDTFWETPAARMVDAQASGLARRVRSLRGAIHPGANWPDVLLARLGELHLLLEGYRRADTLSAAVRADLRALVGWTQSPKALLNADARDLARCDRQQDIWGVLGRHVTLEDRLQIQRVWLRGYTSNRLALVLDFAFGSAPLDASLVPGTAIDAELVFFASNFPLRAVVRSRASEALDLPPLSGSPGIAAALEPWREAIARVPWLDPFPLLLREVRAFPDGNVYDAAGSCLPLVTDCLWELVAIAGGHPIDLFGEWSERRFRPLSAFADGQFWSLT